MSVYDPIGQVHTINEVIDQDGERGGGLACILQ